MTSSLFSVPHFRILRWVIFVLLFKLSGVLYCQYSFKSAPEAIITGSDTICPGDTAWVTVTLISGTFPWDFSYLHNAILGGNFYNLTDSSISLPLTQPGIYTLSEIADANGTVAGSGESAISLYQVPEISIRGIREVYLLDFVEIDTIIGTPEGGTYYGQGVIGNYFSPMLAGAGKHRIDYVLTTQDGCIVKDSMIVEIWESPARVTIVNNDTSFCSNDAPFLVEAENVYSDTGSFSISGGAGLTDNGDNSATVYPALLGPGLDTITYSYSVNGETFKYYATFEVEGSDIGFTTQNHEEFIANAVDAEYKWIDCMDSTTLGNERSFTAPVDGSYAIIVSQNGCIDTSECFIGYVPGWNGTKSMIFDNVRIYPNPTHGNIAITLDGYSSQINVEITDIEGSIVQKEIFFNQNELQIRMPEQQGIYFLKMTTGKEEKLFKVVRN